METQAKTTPDPVAQFRMQQALALMNQVRAVKIAAIIARDELPKGTQEHLRDEFMSLAAIYGKVVPFDGLDLPGAADPGDGVHDVAGNQGE